MKRDWPLLTDEARRLRNLIQEYAWLGRDTEAFERDLKSVLALIARGEHYLVPF